MLMKICPKCQVTSLIKHWKRNWKQRYKCKLCDSVIRWNSRPKVDKETLYDDFCFENRTYKQLSKKYKVTIKTIQKWLDEALFKKKKSLSVKV